ncbi:MAG: ORC-CDC6 family AAA ATPase [Planctomycetota bacterium]
MNPFHTLYLTEGVEAVDIPALFSPVLVPHVQSLFLPGNVELRGMQGTGKSMLLALLDTSVRLQFWKHRSRKPGLPTTDDPVPAEHRRFIGAGINLSKSNAFKLRGIKLSKEPKENIHLACQCFADFVNCWVLKDLFDSLETMICGLTSTDTRNRLEEVGLTDDVGKLDQAVAMLGDDPRCDFLAGHKSVEQLYQSVNRRVTAYKRLITNPRNKLSADVENTRSLLGEPLSAATEALRTTGVINERTNIFITLDQFETLDRKAPYPGDDERVLGLIRVVDELISGRDSSVSYRIGTRPNTQLRLSDASRDYSQIDLDAILQKKESGRKRRNDLFYRFAADAFVRRVAGGQPEHADAIVSSSTPLNLVFGSSPKTAERGRLSASKSPKRVVKIDKDWPDDVGEFLSGLAKSDPISARLGEAWVRQRLAKDEELDVKTWTEPDGPPWESKAKRWWRKERLPLAALQVATRNSQRLLYYGDMDIVHLSGENILVFVSICREIWECDKRFRALDVGSRQSAPKFEQFDHNRQSEGIRDASRSWRDNIRSSPDGDTLQRFLDELGRRLHSKLISDRRMSYPGANGISLARRDYEASENLDIKRLLDAATAECFLLKRDHTPKNTSRGKSIKWYPHPILAPYYELTVPHTKEPLYVTTDKLRDWLEPHVIPHRVEAPGHGKPSANAETAGGVLKSIDRPPADSGTAYESVDPRQMTFGFDEVD